MKLAAFRFVEDAETTRRVGLVVGDGRQWWLHPFPEGVELVPLLAADLEDRESAADEAAQADGLRPDEVVLLPPVYPTAMRGFLTFESHVESMQLALGTPGVPEEWYAAPVFQFMAPHSVVGPHDDVPYPPGTELLDFGLSLGAIVCRDVRNETPEKARSAIGGYCVVNDWSARDVQRAEMRVNFGPSKGKDFATTLGPWVVTADELERHVDGEGFLDLAMSVSVNGKRVGADVSGHMSWTFQQLVSHASRGSWVKRGEVLTSGTCSSGSLAEAWARAGHIEPPALRVGDVVEMSIEGIGSIQNRVVRRYGSVPPVQGVRRRVPRDLRVPRQAARAADLAGLSQRSNPRRPTSDTTRPATIEKDPQP
ncbi:fumarylacetoacetate hydrolase family protein [Nostocoides sp. HKS02]|uniref:fumarylacetoacetate hydrolase family protein n=1 Tax=Nostocoides sp. HKS02 TaxID=1813880 RepID=UPI0012B475D1|nr:fumarylacetoacetate hydrolase family protein [Tetrasphaera sp. HKS02]QGN57713.1 hydroxylase [Tetrasphaera sp. HKS02]